MKNVARASAAIGISAGLLFLVAPPVSAGESGLTVEVTATAHCVASGQAEVTWVATVNPPSSPETSIVIPPVIIEGMKSPLGGPSAQAVVQFDGVQSGAATGAVSFDPFQQTVPASNSSFPVDSQAVVLDPGAGGTVTLDVDVLIFNAADPEESFTVTGAGSVDLPVCDQPVETTASTAAEATTRPRFTG
jgi:hypothetical protein